MIKVYPQYDFTKEDAQSNLARFVRLDNPKSYPFDEFHSHEYNEMLLFVEGGGIHNIDFKEYKIERNSIHLLAAGSLHWLERGMKSEGFAIVYKDQFLHKLQQYHEKIDFAEIFSRSEVINLNKKETEEFNLIIQEIWNNKANSEYILSLIGVLLTKIVLTFFPNESVETKRVPMDKTLVEMITLINKHYKERLSTAEYAQKLHISISTLQRKAKAYTGKSITALQQERLLKEAKKLLTYPETSIKEVAWELGFHEVAHFSNWFKKLTHTAPAQYTRA